jgi:hypothetical protein
MSNTTDRSADTNLSASRTLDGISKDTAAIPAVTAAADRRSDSGHDVADPHPIAPPARTSRRGFLMNTMISAASLATATAVSVPPIAAATVELPEVLSLASEILRLNELVHQDDDEISRLLWIWRDRMDQLQEEAKYTADERREIVTAMPETVEHERLICKAESYFAVADKLVKRLWSLPAKTAEGKKAKVRVLFEYILNSDWRCSDEDADWNIEMTRKLLFELAGTSTAEILGDQADDASTSGEGIEISPAADPIFAAIDAHRTAWAALERDCSALDDAADDDEEAQQKLDALHDAIDEAENGLLDVIPTTVAGVSAILSYAADHVRRGSAWGDGYVDEDPLSGWCKNRGVPWEVILHRNLAGALGSMA